MRGFTLASTLGLALASAVPGPASAQTQTLWSYGVPGALVGKYQSDCNKEADRYRGQGTVRFDNRPGRVWGSNDVACVLTRTPQPQQAKPPVAASGAAQSGSVNIKGRLIPISQLRHNGNQVYYGNELVGRVGSGGRVLSNDGGSLVAQGGGNLVAQGGGNLVAQGGGN